MATLTYTAEPTNTQTPTITPSVTPTLTPTVEPTSTPVPTQTPKPVGAIVAYFRSEGGSSSLYTTDIDYGEEQRLTPLGHDVIFYDWSPDGTKIVYQTYRGVENETYVISWNGVGEPQKLLSDSNNGYSPVWSPDGKKIAYFATKGHWAIFTMNADATGKKAITGNTVSVSVASWSPDGTRIAYNPMHNTMSPSFIACVNVDGSNYIELTTDDSGWGDYDPVWSPVDDIILFSSWRSGSMQVYSIKPDGTELHALTDSVGGNTTPVWSPDGSKIAFVSWRDSDNPDECEGGDCNFEIYVMNADGSDQQRLTNNPAEDWGASWSPDGSKIAFQSLRDEPRHPNACGDQCNSEIYVMNADGSNVIRITNNKAPDSVVSWQPSNE